MKKIISLVVALALLLSGCGIENFGEEEKIDISNTAEFSNLRDRGVLAYINEDVYERLVEQLDGEDYFIENVSTKFISEEYLSELKYNLQDNIYFGFTLEELGSQFGDEKYVFTCNDAGETVVKAYENFDDTYDQIINNVLVGSGVILVCVTVSVLSGGVGATTVSMIFAMSAKTGTAAALSTAVISGAVSAAVTGAQTHDMEQTLKNAGLAASEGYKLGAITGVLTGVASESSALKGATLHGLSMKEAAQIQKESGYSVDIIKQFKSLDEYRIYKEAGLYTKTVNGKPALIRDIDLKFVSELPDGRKVTNLQRMRAGYAPLEPSTGKAYQLHHIGQKSDGALAILTETEHQGNSAILNIAGKTSEIDRNAFSEVRKQFWTSLGYML